MSRFFHSLVVFGAGVSLSGCGGKTTDANQHTDEGAGGSSGVGSGGESANGGVQSIVGGAGGGVQTILGGATGGATGIVGTPLPPADPYIDAGPVPDLGTLAQWDCTQQTGNCEFDSDGIGLELLRRACPVDKSRPRAASDCDSTQWFECDEAVLDGRRVAVTCRCMPGGDSGVSCDLCTPLNPGLTQRTISCVSHSKICGCAVTLIR